MTDRSPLPAARTPELHPAASVAKRIRAWRGQLRPGALAALVLVSALSGCGTNPPPPPQPAAAPTPDSVSPLMVQVDPTAALLATQVSKAREMLAEADDLLAREEYEGAAAKYEQVSVMHLSDDPDEMHELQVEGLWGVAIANLLITPNRLANSNASRTALQTLIASYDGTRDAITARWMLGMIDEMDRLRVQGARNAEDIRRLTEMVDQLKRIDLTRRPGGSRR
jgi:hypothetical protein